MKVLRHPPNRAVRMLGKSGVTLQPQAVLMLDLARHIIEDKLGIQEMWWTSGLEGTHKAGSLHYLGLAIDIDIVPHPGPAKWLQAVNWLEKEMPIEVQVKDEHNHIHLEWDPD